MNTPPPEEESVTTQEISVKDEPVAQPREEPVFFSVSTFISDTGETTTVPETTSDEITETTSESEVKKELDNSSVVPTDVGNDVPLTEGAVVASNVEIQEAALAEQTHDNINEEFSVPAKDVDLRETDEDVKHEPAVTHSLELPQSSDERLNKMGVGEPETSDRYGDICVTLESKELWHQFSTVGTEMIITKAGRRMFPALIISVTGLEQEARYSFFMDIIPVDNERYKYLNSKWIVVGKAEKEMEPRPQYVHPESPNTGQHWMSQKISFKKMKLTNNKKTMQGHLVLNSMHKYQPRVHVVREGEDVHDDTKHGVFVFPETVFIAVTAYQNDQITQLKIDHNPFAKAFRDSPQESELLRSSGWPHHFYRGPVSPVPDSPYFSQDFSGQMRFGHMPYSPWDSPLVAPRTPLTPATPYRQQDSLTGWPNGYMAPSTPLSSQCGTEEAFATPYSTYGSTGLHPQGFQVPLTPITPASLDPYVSYGPSAGYNVNSLASQTSQSAFGGSMEQVKYQPSLMPGSQNPFHFQHPNYGQSTK